jgi:hypothetical protein
MKYTYALLEFPQRPTEEMPAEMIPPKIEDQLLAALENFGRQGYDVFAILPHPRKKGHVLVAAKRPVRRET